MYTPPPDHDSLAISVPDSDPVYAPPENLRSMPQLRVTFYRIQRQGPMGRTDPFLNTATHLSAKQQVVVNAFIQLMSKDAKSEVRTYGDDEQGFTIYPYAEPVIYTPDVFQLIFCFYTQTSETNLHAFRARKKIKDFEKAHRVEVVFDLFQTTKTPSFPNRPVGLAMFDMDSTLINEEVIDELARSIGVSDKVSAITARAMNGEIDFATSLQERVEMLKGVKADVWEDLKKVVTIADGARELVTGLKKRGVKTGVISGGFTPMAEWLKGELGLDYAFANHLLTAPATSKIPYPHLTGTLDPDKPIVTPELKKSTLISLANDHGIPILHTFAVGDGSNDLLMLGAAGLGIAWNAKTRVQEAAPMRLNGPSLAELLYLLGPEEKQK